jgi:hypothetical protein
MYLYVNERFRISLSPRSDAFRCNYEHAGGVGPRVVTIRGDPAGLEATKALADTPMEVILVGLYNL